MSWTGALLLTVLALGASLEPATLAQEADSSIEVQITGDEYQWHIRYPGNDGRLGTSDDPRTVRHLHLPAETNATLKLQSRDYVYSLKLPHLGLEEIAVPDLDFQMRFQTGAPGTFELLGDQFCGYAHEELIGRLIVQSAPEFEAWLATLHHERPGASDEAPRPARDLSPAPEENP